MRLKSIAEFEAQTGPDAPTTAERDLIDKTKAGEACVLYDGKSSLPTAATGENRIRSSLLRLLITGGTPHCGLHERGVSLIGGWIDGPLDLAYCTATGQTILANCHFNDRPRFEYGRFSLLSLAGSALPQGLLAQGVTISGSLLLKNINAASCVDVNSARIGGQLVCESANFVAGGDAKEKPLEALDAQGVEVERDLVLRNVTAVGTVAVNGAKIGGQFDCTGARFDSEMNSQASLNAQGVEVGLDLFLDDVTANGTVDLNGAKIGGQLGCVRAHLVGTADWSGKFHTALKAQRMRVNESFIFLDVAQTTGPINLAAAHVGDLVDDEASWPTGRDQLILDGFTYDRLAGSAPTTCAARRDWLMAGSHRRGEFRPQPYTELARVLRQMGHASEARKVLMEAALVEAKTFQEQHRVRQLFARAARWFSRDPTEAGLQELRATFGELPQSLQAEANETLGLLQRYHLPLPIPKNAPSPPDPLTLAYARQDFRNRLWWRAVESRMAILGSRIKHGFLSLIVGHGHAPQRAILAVLVSTVVAAFWYAHAWTDGAMVPNSDVILTSFNWWWEMQDQALTPTEGWTTTGTARHYETFYSLAYAFDVIVPLVDLGQQSAWSATTVTWTGLATRILTMALEVWGWVVTALGAAAVTGLVQRNQPD